MIAKRVPRRAGTSSPARLVRYMVAAQGGIEPESWQRTADYILDTKGATTQGEKVSSYRVTNCGTDDPGDATALIQVTQAKNTRSKSDKTYHLVYSFPPGERPPLDVLHAIEDELCAAIGYADHQRISAVHIDTDHLHVHVAINKVHPTGLQNIEPFFDKQRLMEACERLEIKHGLQRTNHGLTEGKAYDRPDRIQLGPERQHDSRFREFLRQSYHLALADRPEAETYNGLRNLSGGDLARGPRRYSELLPNHARDRLDEGRSEPIDGLRRAGNGASRDGGDRAGRIDGKAGDMEAHAGVESLIGYVARDVAPAIRQARTWQDVHIALREHGLQITTRGAGLVIGDAEFGLWCKASAAGRDLSIKALTDRLGPFEPDTTTPLDPSPRRRYIPRPRQPHVSSTALFAEYQRQRQAALAGRKEGLAAIKAEQLREAQRIRKWAAAQRHLIRSTVRGPGRKALYANVAAQAAAARRANADRAAAKRKALFAATALPIWNDWLMRRAESGDTDALAVLRSRAERAERLRGDLLTAERADRARAAVMEAVKPTARKDGTMSYRTADGGVVLDRATHVQAERATAGAALVALSLAAERFAGQALDVRGSDQFRRDVARLAALHKIPVVFADPAMEALRQSEAQALTAQTPRTTPERPQTPPAEPGRPGAGQSRPPESVSPAILEWIEKRNSDRARISSINYNRLWTPADAGAAIYQGRRRMEDGSEVIVLARGNETLVKPAGPRVVAKASRWRVGQSVSLDARGRFIDPKGKGVDSER